jgi:hypothetical protein
LEHYHGQAIDQALCLGVFSFNRLESITQLNKMRNKTFPKSTVLSSWKVAGFNLIPLNPNKAVEPLCEKLRGRTQTEEEERLTSPTQVSLPSQQGLLRRSFLSYGSTQNIEKDMNLKMSRPIDAIHVLLRQTLASLIPAQRRK